MASILVVDDDDAVRNILLELFAIEHTCDAAATAEQAFTYLSVQQYDVVVTDYQMPGLSGLDLLANINETQKKTPVILISGLSTKDRATELIQMGAFDYVVKPFTLSERAAALSSSEVIAADQVLPATAVNHGLPVGGTTRAAAALERAPATLEALEREHILRVLHDTDGNRERAAAILGISSRTLYRKLREYETSSKSAGLATEA